jgi:SAM-dependent methyltransferase
MNREFVRRHLVPIARHLPESLQRPLRQFWRATAAKPATAATRFDDDEYRARVAAETAIFNDQTEVHDLPRIFHYWSNTYLRQRLETFGFSNPDQFFATYLERAHADAAGHPARFISIGAGNSDTEVRVARILLDRGIGDFTLECLELNPTMIERGRALALEQGVAAQVLPIRGDFNLWRAQGGYDAVMANQSLHHVSNLEGLFDAIKAALTPGGRFITSDMIGRNGHRRWPEALAIVQEFWKELPDSRRYNLQLRRNEATFLDWDCSVEGFEGIRAQDILPLLIERFGFEFFFAFGNVIDPFIDRSFGHHFDFDSVDDRAFIDRIHARDEAEILAGNITPTHLMAVMRNISRAPRGETTTWKHLTPEFCLRDLQFGPAAQRARKAAS